MNSTAACLPASPAASNLAATLQRMRATLLRTSAVMFALCVLIALLLNGFALTRLAPKLVYSFAIGLCCWLATNLGRVAVAAWVDRRRRRRGLAPQVTPAGTGWPGVGVGVALGVLLGPLAGLQIADALTGNTSPSLLQLDSGSTRATLLLALAGSLVATYVLGNMERLASARALAEAAQRLAAENQLRLLQSQLEPHMLFNTLANLRVLIGIDAVRAQTMLDSLIAFLRTTLSASRNATHPLADEFAHLADYLALMAVRMGPRLAVRLDLPDPLRALAVPPLLLQPLVENAIKHGLEPKVDGGRIDVRAQRSGDTLMLTVRDSGVGLTAAAHAASAAGAPAASHFGIEQVRMRLATLFAGRATLVLHDAADPDGGVLATITLPLT